MANHISNYLEIRNSNPAVLAYMEWVFERIDGQYDTGTEELAKKVYGEEYPAEYNRGWVIDNCGAKWFNGIIDESGDDYINIQMESAWDPPSDWIVRLTEKLLSIKNDIIITNTYEDEAYNFVGVQLCAKFEEKHTLIDMDNYDLEKIWDDDEMRDALYDEQYAVKEVLLTDYTEKLKEMGKNNGEYSLK